MVRVSLAAAWVAAACGFTACGPGADAEPAPEMAEIAGGWVSDTLPALMSEGRVARLEVRSDSQAALSTEYVRRGTVSVSGYWQVRGREFTLQPVDLARRPIARPLVWRLEGGRLVPVSWDREIHGEAGIPLHRPVRSADPADTTGTREGR